MKFWADAVADVSWYGTGLLPPCPVPLVEAFSPTPALETRLLQCGIKCIKIKWIISSLSAEPCCSQAAQTPSAQSDRAGLSPFTVNQSEHCPQHQGDLQPSAWGGMSAGGDTGEQLDSLRKGTGTPTSLHREWHCSSAGISPRCLHGLVLEGGKRMDVRKFTHWDTV